jgi:hypothetical protein
MKINSQIRKTMSMHRIRKAVKKLTLPNMIIVTMKMAQMKNATIVGVT